VIPLRVIPTVFVTDLFWLAAVGGLVRLAPTRRIRILAWVMLAYVACEALFHVYMESAAAAVMGRF
jgi:hypothetical protein